MVSPESGESLYICTQLKPGSYSAENQVLFLFSIAHAATGEPGNDANDKITRNNKNNR